MQINPIDIKFEEVKEDPSFVDPETSRENKKTQRQKCINMKYGFSKMIEVWNKSKGKCAYCNKKLTYSSFTLDHIIPIGKGGVTSAQNLVIACNSCNTMKEGMLPEEFKAERRKLYLRLKKIYESN